MELTLIFKALLALIFVIGLLFLTLWLFKACRQQGAKCRFFQKLQENKRIKIIENHKLDMKNSLLIFQKDDSEFLLLLGNTQNLLLETKKISGRNHNAHD